MSLRAMIRDHLRNRLARLLAQTRHAALLQPLHRRFGPFKYDYLLPAVRRLKRLLQAASQLPEAEEALDYQQWLAFCQRLRLDEADHAKAGEMPAAFAEPFAHQFAYQPTISILLPVYNPPLEFLRRALDSVRRQSYGNWQLCACDDGSTDKQVAELLRQYATEEARVNVSFAPANGGIAQASNRALALATGEFLGLLDHDDELAPEALYEVVRTLQEVDADVLYTDEDRLDAAGNHTEPRCKPAWSPDLLLSCMYVSHLVVYRRQLVLDVGGFRQGFDGSQDYDLALRVTERTEKIAHIPKILYHWRKVAASASARRQAREAVTEAGRRALTEALQRRRIEGEVENQPRFGFYRVRRALVAAGKVSIIIPTRDGFEQLRRAVQSIESKSLYRDYEILIVDNGSRDRATLDYLRASPHGVLRLDEAFNFSRLCNRAAKQAQGDYLLFLNDDTEVISGEWLSAMLEQAQRPEVGAVGAKLLYADGRIQHAGVLLGVGARGRGAPGAGGADVGVAGHALRYEDGFSGAGYLNYANVARNYSAVTAACLMVRRAVFAEVGGFDEEAFAISYNDVDFCLRLGARGYRIVYTPYALLYHKESASRGLQAYPQAAATLRGRWQRQLASDAFYNPNLAGEDFCVNTGKPQAHVEVFASEVLSGIFSAEVLSATAAQAHANANTNDRGQEFAGVWDDLCAIAVRLPMRKRQSGREAEQTATAADVKRWRLRLCEAVTGEVVRVTTVQSENRGWTFFSFAPLGKADGRRYRFTLERLVDTEDVVRAMPVSPASEENAGQPLPLRLPFRVYRLEQFRYPPTFT